MYIKSLKINNLRNLEAVSIEADPIINLFSGDNGAGKTSILEGLVVLAKGRSFRSPSIRSLIGPSSEQFTVVADYIADGDTAHRAGLERSSNEWRGRRDGQDISRFSELGRDLPLVVMEPDSHELVSGAPERRRRYLDWGVFHVEPSFLDTWRRYERALRQRNAALRRRQASFLDAVDPQVAELGEALGHARRAQAEAASERLSKILPVISPELADVTLSYREGWKGAPLSDALIGARAKDMERGATGPGPHRGDIRLSIDGGPARERLSRGECKALSSAMLLSQARLLLDHGARPVLLLDDLASELDESHRERVLSMVLDMGLQTWITGTQATLPGAASADSVKRFHVEHGQVLEMV